MRRKLKYHVACTVDGFVAAGKHVTDYLASLKSDYDIVLIGSGLPLFSQVIKQTALELVASKIYGNGVLLLQYRVKH